MEITSRQSFILRKLVKAHVERQQPVGSKWLAEQDDVPWGPSTVRAELARLEEAGLLEHPHTSAGRVPTDRGYRFYADELLDDVNTVLNVQLALAAHRTGEVMRILTVFSVFFLPLTFLVGVYGMNFDFMPELHARWGYPVVLAAMGVITLAIYLWFRRRGWLRE